ncbi:MAG: trypsin-like serine protease [Leptolyngbyaceae cyanobacterium CSU_1_3]|nr:trypsin-like serine protease [Leptolyngbyaceae cyanobacterium CSU_1_3]
MLQNIVQTISLMISSSVLLSSSLFFAPTTYALSLNNQTQPNETSKIASSKNSTSLTDSSDIAESVEPAIGRLVTMLNGKMTWKGKTYTVRSGVSGTGFLISQNGYVATNRHVVEPANNPQDSKEFLAQDLAYQLVEKGKISFFDVIFNPDFVKDLAKQAELSDLKLDQTLVMSNGKKLDFKIAAVDEHQDIAIVKVDAQNAPVLKLADSRQVRVAQYVSVIGYPGIVDRHPWEKDNPIHESSNLIATLTDGRISAKKQLEDRTPIFQISAVINHGNSGGPVLNAEGEVVGIATLGYDTSGYAFALPSNALQQLMQKNGISNDESRFNSIYRDAIALYHQKLYGQALSKFLQAQRLFPYSAELDQYIRACSLAMQAKPIS